jgi:hypothetical protein
MSTRKTKVTKETDESKKEEVKTLSKQQLIGLIIIFISILIIVYVAFLAMDSRPVEKMTKDEALITLKTIYGSTWLLDENGDSYPLGARNKKYEKILLTTDLDRERVSLPYYLYFDADEEIIGRELSFIYFDESTNTLRTELPDSRVYDFVYSKTKDGRMENLAFVSEDNKRTYYINETAVEKEKD